MSSVEPRRARLSRAIESSGLSVSSFARRAGLDPSNLLKVVSGKLRLTDNAAARIARAHGLSARWLSGGEGPMRPPEPVLVPPPAGAGDAAPDLADVLGRLRDVSESLAAALARQQELSAALARQQELLAESQRQNARLIELVGKLTAR